MAPASPTTVLAVLDRPQAERSEVKSPDGSDGQFAGLMAQFVQSPKAPETTEPPSNESMKVEKESRAEPREANPAPAETVAGTGQARTEAPAPLTPASPPAPMEVPLEGTLAILPGPLQPFSSPQGIPLSTVGPSAPLKQPAVQPDPMPVASPVAASTLPGMVSADSLTGPESSRPSAEPTPETLPPSPGGTDPKPRTLPQAVAISAPAEGLVRVPSPAPQPAPPTQPVALTQTNIPVDPLQAPSAPEPQAVLAAPAFRNPPVVLAQANTPVNPLQAPSAPEPRAVLAESAPRTKETPKPERMSAPSDASKAPESLQVVLVSKEAATAPSADTAVLAPMKAPSRPSAPILPQDSPAMANSSDRLPPAESRPTHPVEGLTSIGTAMPQPPTIHSPDGSNLAAMNAMPKPLETVPAPAAALPATPAAPTLPVAQVESGFRWMLKGGAQEARLQLHPESLGQVTIHLKVEGGEVHARLWITEPASVQAVQEGRPHLELSLKEQGLQLGSFDLHQGHRPFQEAPTASAFREASAPERIPARQEAPEPLPVSILNPRHVELYA